MLSSGFHRGVESWGYAERKFHYYTRLYFFFFFFFFQHLAPFCSLHSRISQPWRQKPEEAELHYFTVRVHVFHHADLFVFGCLLSLPAVLYPLILRLLVPLPTSDFRFVCVNTPKRESANLYVLLCFILLQFPFLLLVPNFVSSPFFSHSVRAAKKY